MNPIKLLSGWGIKSDYAFLAGFVSIGLSLASIAATRATNKIENEKGEHAGIFVGHWAPTFFALGLALQHEEHHKFLDH